MILWPSYAKTSPIANDIGLASPSYTATFDEIVFPMGEFITNQYYLGFGVDFSGAAIPGYPVGGTNPGFNYDVQGYSTPTNSHFLGIDGHYIGSSAANPLYIKFSGVQSEIAFGFASNRGQFIIAAFLDGTLVESFSLFHEGGSFPITYYYGFEGTSFNTIEIESVLYSDNIYDNRILIDNIQFTPSSSSGVVPITPPLIIPGVIPSPAPLPGAVLILGTGIGCLALYNLGKQTAKN
jgi:hypothetical protein